MHAMVPPEADISVAITADITQEITDRLLNVQNTRINNANSIN